MIQDIWIIGQERRGFFKRDQCLLGLLLLMTDPSQGIKHMAILGSQRRSFFGQVPSFGKIAAFSQKLGQIIQSYDLFGMLSQNSPIYLGGGAHIARFLIKHSQIKLMCQIFGIEIHRLLAD